MNFKHLSTLLNKNKRFAVLILLAIISAILLGYYLGVAALLHYIEHPFLILSEKIANLFLTFSGSSINFINHRLIHNGIASNDFVAHFFYKKVTIFYMLLVWLFIPKLGQKIIFSLALFLIQILGVAAYNIVNARVYIGTDKAYTITVLNCIVFFIMNSVFLLAYLLNKIHIVQKKQQFYKLLPHLIGVMFVYCLVLFCKAVFQFKLWIYILFESSRIILSLLGFEVWRESNILNGEYGSIALAKDCLGIMTIFVFAAFVYLTGIGQRNKKWIYIIAGILVLNITNIIRFVFLFAHLQKHENVKLTLDVHDVYTYITYGIVFILWIVWIEMIRGNKITTKEKH